MKITVTILLMIRSFKQFNCKVEDNKLEVFCILIDNQKIEECHSQRLPLDKAQCFHK